MKEIYHGDWYHLEISFDEDGTIIQIYVESRFEKMFDWKEGKIINAESCSGLLSDRYVVNLLSKPSSLSG